MQFAIPRLPVCLLALGIAVSVAANALAQELEPLDANSLAKIAEIEKCLQQSIETKHFQNPMPLNKFLAKLEELLPKDKKVSLRIDENAFGKTATKVRETPVVLGEFPHKMSLMTALRFAMSQIPLDNLDVDYRLFPTHFAITTRQHSAYAAVHEIGDHVRNVLPKLKKMGRSFPDGWELGQSVDWSNIKAGKEAEFLARLITSVLPNDTAAVTLEVRNASKLVVHANHSKHRNISNLLMQLSRLADLAVVMHARILEVDRACYDKHIAPLFAASEKHPNGRLLASVDTKLMKMLAGHKVILRDEGLRIVPGPAATFLSLHNLLLYVDPNEVTGFGTLQSGVSFSVEAAVSDDRRRLELKIKQTVAELVDIKKTRALDARTNKEIEIESPNVRRNSLSGSLVIWDGHAIVMPVSYRSPVVKKQDRLWIMLAEPRIYIEEEEEQIRLGNLPPLPDPEEHKMKELPPKRPAGPARSEKVEQVLQAIVKDLLTNPELKSYREFKNRAGKMKFRLEDGANVAWPDWFNPTVSGYARDSRDLSDPDDPELNPGHTLVIRLDKFDLSQGKSEIFNTPIVVSFHNPAFIRGLSVYFALKRDRNRWDVEFHGCHSP